jgi:hypothetical protein
MTRSQNLQALIDAESANGAASMDVYQQMSASFRDL